jgi:Mrp family chromosome partitioning ATPase
VTATLPSVPTPAVSQFTTATETRFAAVDAICAAASLPTPPMEAPIRRAAPPDVEKSKAGEQRQQRDTREIQQAKPTSDSNETDSSDEATDPGRSVAPSWEIDCFAWPPVCEQLCRCAASLFDHAGERLRTAAGQGLNALAIASSVRGEGCSTLALCLARSAAKAGVRVALMDADFDGPELAALLGVEAPCGWPEVLLRQLPLMEAAVGSLGDRLALLPVTAADGNGRVAIIDPPVAEAVEEASRAFELVIIDMGPLSENTGRLYQRGDVPPIDAAIIVRDLRRTSEEQALEAAARLYEIGVEAVGIAENFGTDDQPLV